MKPEHIIGGLFLAALALWAFAVAIERIFV